MNRTRNLPWVAIADKAFVRPHGPLLRQSSRGKRKGFTLLEFLVVVAMMGVLIGIGILSLTNINERSNDAKDRRNAQSAASLYSSARAAGATFSSDPTDKAGLVGELITGKNGRGSLSTTVFKMTGVDFPSNQGLLRYLECSAEMGMIYHYEPVD